MQFDAFLSVLYSLSVESRDIFMGYYTPPKKNKNDAIWYILIFFLIKCLSNNSLKISMFMLTTTRYAVSLLGSFILGMLHWSFETKKVR